MHNRNLWFIGIWVLLVCVGSSPVQAVTRLDATFGLNGRVAVELGAKSSGHAVIVQPDGKIVVAGSSTKKTASQFSLLRFNKDGSLDPTFHGDGSVITSVSSGDNEALALALLSDGRIVAGGYSSNGTDRDFALVCYLPDGSLDRFFGENGAVVTSIGNGNEEITAMTVNAEDMITVVGTTEGTAGRVLVTARYFADGTLDLSYGEQGMSLMGIGEDAVAEGIIVRKNGSLVVSGSYKDMKVSSVMLVGLDADGVLDSGFGEKGVAIPSSSFTASEGYGLAEDGNGLIYLAGSVGVAGKRDTALFRFTQTGKVDDSFGDHGVIVNRVSAEDDVLYGVTIGKSGVVASGFTTDAGTRQFLVASYAGGGGETASSSSTSAEIAPKSSVDFASSKKSSIQEVQANSRTKVQIRRLQVVSASAGAATARNIRARLSPDSRVAATSVQARPVLRQAKEPLFFARSLSIGVQRLGNFLMPSAIAAANNDATVTGVAVSPQTVTTTFSAGEAVSYAAATDRSGNVIVVGTADGAEGSSIVVARYAAEPAIDAITDQPGERNRYLTTTPPVDITRTTAVTGFEIVPSLGKEVAKRGVVFSTSAYPVYSGSGQGSPVTMNSAPPGYEGGLTASGSNIILSHCQNNSTEVGHSSNSLVVATIPSLPQKTIERITSFLVPGAVAATSDTIPTATGNSLIGDFVERGETENGSGYGRFSAVLEKLKPGTLYFVRAYALTSEGSVYYGNQLSFKTADACFIATASFGTLLHPSVRVLRDFRDSFLLGNALGRKLVDLYYTFSPPLADAVAQNGLFRFAVRLILLPFIGFSWLALQGGMVLALSIFAGTAVMLGWWFSRIRSAEGTISKE